MIIPSGSTVILEYDNISFLGAQKVLEKIFLRSGRSALKVKDMIIAVGGRVGRYAA